jgi:hypothetical protein
MEGMIIIRRAGHQLGKDPDKSIGEAIKRLQARFRG